MEAERIPPLDGFMEIVPEGYTLTEEEEMKLREQWFDNKRERELAKERSPK